MESLLKEAAKHPSEKAEAKVMPPALGPRQPLLPLPDIPKEVGPYWMGIGSGRLGWTLIAEELWIYID